MAEQGDVPGRAAGDWEDRETGRDLRQVAVGVVGNGLSGFRVRGADKLAEVRGDLLMVPLGLPHGAVTDGPVQRREELRGRVVDALPWGADRDQASDVG